MNKKSLVKLIACILIPLIIGGISGFYTSSNITSWYSTLNRPSWNPPNYVFGPVWTTLYILMGVSLYMVLEKSKPEERNKLLLVFGVQMILNFMWSILFFKNHRIDLALVEIVFLWSSIFTMIYMFSKVSKTAAYLNVPYISWVSFATLLNYTFYSLNP